MYALRDATCPDCGAGVEWATKDEPTVVKIRLDCPGCGRAFPAPRVSKDDDTTDDGLRQAARDAVEREHGSIF